MADREALERVKRKFRPENGNEPGVPFVARRPTAGDWLVDHRRARVQGQVSQVRNNGTVLYHTYRVGSVKLQTPLRVEVDWEEAQYRGLRFVKERPRGYRGTK